MAGHARCNIFGGHGPRGASHIPRYLLVNPSALKTHDNQDKMYLAETPTMQEPVAVSPESSPPHAQSQGHRSRGRGASVNLWLHSYACMYEKDAYVYTYMCACIDKYSCGDVNVNVYACGCAICNVMSCNVLQCNVTCTSCSVMSCTVT